jgi:hypothetical protein
MRCIFCKKPSGGCISVEHIIPESLGNVDHVLPRGWVCDTCNNYFAREVEKPFLDSLYGRSSRFEMSVANKRGRVPSVFGLHPQSRTRIEVARDPETNRLCLSPAEGEDESRWIASVQANSHGTLYVPFAPIPDSDLRTSRFIGKVALEVLAYRCIQIPGWNDEIVDKADLDELRRYVRSGSAKSVWPVSIRRIYAADFLFQDKANGAHEMLHEWTILWQPGSECYAVIAIFGVEYAINLGGPELDGYNTWLKAHGDRSPLYDEPSAQSQA